MPGEEQFREKIKSYSIDRKSRDANNSTQANE
jgi:hypothetical protein